MSRGIRRDGAPARLCWPVEAWPARDRALWQRALAGSADLFEEGGSRARLRPITNRGVAQGYGRWLQTLAGFGELDPDQSPAQRITRERVRVYVEHLQASGNHGSTIALRLEQLQAAALVMDPGQDWSWLRRPAARLRARSRPKRDKRERLVAAQDLLALGLDLMARSQDEPRPGQRAVIYRDGLMIAFLALQPLRLKNLAGLTLGRTLVQVEDRWTIVLTAEDTKTHAAFETAWPESLAPALAHYLEAVRPVLLQRRRTAPEPAGGSLWVSAEGRPLSAKRINAAIKLRTRHAFGRAVNPHLFRDAAVTTLALQEPQHARAAAPVLGHARLTTTERHYQQASSLQAQGRYADVLGRHRTRS